MKILLFFCISLVSGGEFNGLRAKFPEYYSIPRTGSEASQNDKWLKVDKAFNKNVDVWCQPNDCNTLLLTDKNGYTCGMGMCMYEEDLINKDLENNDSYLIDYYKSSSNFEEFNYFGKKMWCFKTLFQSPENLAKGSNNNYDITEDNAIQGVWFKDVTGNWEELSKDECQVNEGFREGKCYTRMGNHWIERLEDFCNKSYGIFSLYNEGKICGFVFAAFGPIKNNTNTQNYKEAGTAAIVKLIAPDSPQCVYDNIKKYGMTTMHVLFTDNPSAITCPSEDWKIKNCKKSPFNILKKGWKKIFNN